MKKKTGVIPGFRLGMGYTLFYLSIIVIIPFLVLVLRGANMGGAHFLKAAFEPRVLASYKVSFGCALVAATINSVFGLMVAWTLVRYDFPLKKFMDGCIDLPFALPTAVAGIALTTLYAPNGWIGKWLYGLGIESAYSKTGITIALVFTGIPFVVRTVQPILEALDKQYEEAATVMGAKPGRIFRKIIFPEIFPALLTGFALAFARGIGEYGSVVFIAGNMPMKTEIAPLLIMGKLEQYDYSGATAIAVVMLGVSFFMILGINVIQWYSNRTMRG